MPRNIFVTRLVHDTARELLRKTPPTGCGAVFSLANEMVDECHNAGDPDGVCLWRDVWLYLTALTFTDGDVEIIEDTPRADLGAARAGVQLSYAALSLPDDGNTIFFADPAEGVNLTGRPSEGTNSAGQSSRLK